MDKKTLILVRRRLQRTRDNAVGRLHENVEAPDLVKADAEILTRLYFDAAIDVIDTMLEEALSNER